MKQNFRRIDSGVRHGLSQEFHGQAFLFPSGVPVRYRGLDVSRYGLGCIIVGNVQMRDVLLINIGGADLHFEVMWVESHLGIDNTYRAGLQCLDRMLDIRQRLLNLGFVTHPLEDEFVA